MRVDPVHGGVVEKGDAVPEDVAEGCFDQDAALADGELGLGPDGPEAEVGEDGFPSVFVGLGGGFESGG